jgi:hypothetical protein
MALTGQSYTFRGSGAGGGGGSSFAPDRTLFVAQAWPVGADPLVYFTAIDAAITQAIALTPAAIDPITIVCYPGVYSEPLALASNVFLVGVGAPNAVTIDGNTSWAPVGAGDESMEFTNLRFSENASLNVDYTGKGGGLSTFEMNDVNFDCGFVFLGRVGNVDRLRWWSGIQGAVGVVSFTDVNTQAWDYLFNGPVRFLGDTDGKLVGCDLFGGPNVIDDSANVQMRACRVANSTTVASGCTLDLRGSILDALLTVAAGGSADLRMCEYGQAANLAGAGEIDRSIWQTSIAGTAAGANVIPIAPPLPSNNYRVVVTQVGGAAAAVVVSAKAANQFTLTDAAGGHDFEFAILRE